MDANGSALFDFTKRIIRRFPKNEGLACYHITDHNPEVREVALRLFRHVGLRGVANAEFKRDPRDGQLKLIECNARFTAANKLVAHAGIDLGHFVYARLIDLPLPPTQCYRARMRLWSPVEDFKAYRELKALGEITFWQWLRSICHWQVFPVFSWRDPMPTLVSELQRTGRILARGMGLRRRITKQRPSTVADAPP
jgi:predicted ATP-grasp superfamily ATP-dependent carboligase